MFDCAVRRFAVAVSGEWEPPLRLFPNAALLLMVERLLTSLFQGFIEGQIESQHFLHRDLHSV